MDLLEDRFLIPGAIREGEKKTRSQNSPTCEETRRGNEPIESCTILTADANELMQPIHERMPVIIPPDQIDLWLDPQCQDAKKLEGLLRPFSGEMTAYQISTVVDNPKNDLVKCIEPLESLF